MEDLTCCQIAEIDDASLVGRCDAGMAMTRTDAMPAATTTAIEMLSTTLNSARRRDISRSTDGASTSAGSICSCKAWATALVNISEFSRRWGSLPGACGGGSSVVNRGRHSAACLSTESGSALTARSLNSRGA